MPDLTIDQWKAFLSARLLQEQGKDSEALETFDRLLAASPGNAHLQASRAFALDRLNRKSDAVGARIAVAYSKAAAALSGDADKPDAWTSELSNLLNEVQGLEKGRGLSAAMAAW